MASQILQKMSIVAQTKPSHSGTVIFMHGSGGTGPMARDGLNMVLGRHLSFPHIRILYPTAPLRPYSLVGGALEHVWFDRPLLTENTPDHLATIEPMAEEINQLIDQETKQGVDIRRILIGGFSMGGAMALHMAYRFRPDIGGAFVLSSFLSKGSKVYEVLEGSNDSPHAPLFMCHGQKDDLVPHSWGHNTFQELQKHHVQGSFHSFPDLEHVLSKEELILLKNWIVRQVPEDSSRGQ